MQSSEETDIFEADYEGESPPPRQAGWWAHARPVLKWCLIVLIGLVFLIHIYAGLLRFLPAPITLNMVGTRLVGAEVERRIVPLNEISPNLVRAVIAAEDSRFCEHNGLDFSAIREAISERQAGKRLRGASTISQQTAKNTFFWNGGGFVRKAGEAWMTLVIERAWGKRRIMAQYLNIAEWGDGIYGAEVAAQARFGKSAADLTSREAALLAAVLPNPNAWRLDPPGNYVSGRAGTLQQRMRVVAGDGLAACVLGD